MNILFINEEEGIALFSLLSLDIVPKLSR